MKIRSFGAVLVATMLLAGCGGGGLPDEDQQKLAEGLAAESGLSQDVTECWAAGMSDTFTKDELVDTGLMSEDGTYTDPGDELSDEDGKKVVASAEGCFEPSDVFLITYERDNGKVDDAQRKKVEACFDGISDAEFSEAMTQAFLGEDQDEDVTSQLEEGTKCAQQEVATQP